ncbi:unnamed protein product [Rotaria sp. Silwood2]|nr:unnamed protein product [Rotaria sp. Silwood2]CAF4568631.1 unnamed protein product [Rotaria sp. Silwood2]
MNLSKFEYLPSELIVERSDSLDGCDLYYAFNPRINTILELVLFQNVIEKEFISFSCMFSQQCHRRCVSFIHISKRKFDLYCNRILRYISTRIVSLTLCGDNSSIPGQLALFLTLFNSLANVFTKLESFKLIDYTKSDEYKRLMPFAINRIELFNENVILPISLHSLAFPYEVSNGWIQILNITISFIEQLHVHLIHMNVLSSFLQRFPYLKRLTAVITGINQNALQIGNIFQSNVILHR